MKVYIPKKGPAKVRIDPHDTWSFDFTLAQIIHPALLQLKATKHGAPDVEDVDVPEHLKATPKENYWDTDSNWFLRWDWVLDEMIWAFEQLKKENPHSQFYSGEVDFNLGEPGPLTYGPNHTLKVDQVAMREFDERIQRGTTLFGKYYRSLWD